MASDPCATCGEHRELMVCASCNGDAELERENYREVLEEVDIGLTILLPAVDTQGPVRRLRNYIRKKIGCSDCGAQFVDGWCPEGHRGIDD